MSGGSANCPCRAARVRGKKQPWERDMHLTTTIYEGAGLVVSAIAVLGGILLRARSGANKNLLDAIVAAQSPGSGHQRQSGRVPDVRPSKGGGPQLSALEGHLRSAILNPQARERLIKDAMRTTGSDRTAAIRKVLSDLHAENNRWS
jgi:hypothetical protein